VRCPSCRGALPGGCSTCRPNYTVGRVTIERGTTAHTCPQCMRGLPCTVEVEVTVNPSSLSSLIGAAIKAPIYFGRGDFEGLPAKWPSDTAWKRDTFPQETQ